LHAGRRNALIALAALVLAACATAPRLTAPRVTVNAVNVDRITATEANFTVVLDLVNPNDREMAVETIDAALTVEDVSVGNAVLASPVRLPALSKATAMLKARAGLAAVLGIGAEIAHRIDAQRSSGGTTPVRYAVSGTAVLAGGWTIPFSRHGEFHLGPTRPAPQ
jgi:LEA14-like dessication related protein